jgi:hypothetical protein
MVCALMFGCRDACLDSQISFECRRLPPRKCWILERKRYTNEFLKKIKKDQSQLNLPGYSGKQMVRDDLVIFLLKEILLVEEQDDGGRHKPLVVAYRVKQLH